MGTHETSIISLFQKFDRKKLFIVQETYPHASQLHISYSDSELCFVYVIVDVNINTITMRWAPDYMENEYEPRHNTQNIDNKKIPVFPRCSNSQFGKKFYFIAFQSFLIKSRCAVQSRASQESCFYSIFFLFLFQFSWKQFFPTQLQFLLLPRLDSWLFHLE